MCNCLQKQQDAAEKHIQEKYPNSDLIELEYSSGVGFGIPLNNRQIRRTFTPVSYTLRKKGSTGKGQTKKTFIGHLFCPFCGKPYPTRK